MADGHGGYRWGVQYDPKYCETVAGMGNGGELVHMVAKAVGVNERSLRRWIKEHPEFDEAFETYKTNRNAWWEEQGILGLNDRNFQASLWTKTMHNIAREHYSGADKVELSGGVNVVQVVTGVPRDESNR
jgi:hypothetical protein